jgi:ATPase subunit of ABC transporter with duplicated ATPase domains
LLRILAGIEPPTRGGVTRDLRLRIGYLAQGFEPEPYLILAKIIRKLAGDINHLEMESSTMLQDIIRTREQAAHAERPTSSIRIGSSDYKQKGYKSYQQGIAKKVAKKAKARQKKIECYLESDDRVEKPGAA